MSQWEWSEKMEQLIMIYWREVLIVEQTTPDGFMEWKEILTTICINNLGQNIILTESGRFHF